MALDHAQVFREEALELLSEVEQTVLELEDDPNDAENVARLFRAMHTVKGSGAMFGFDEVSRFTHEVETVWDLVRAGQLPIGKPLLDLTLLSRDHILALLSSPDDAAAVAASDVLIERLRGVAGRMTAVEGAPAAKDEQADSRPTGERGQTVIPATWWVRYRPRSDSYSCGIDPLMFLRELESLGKIWPIAHTKAVPPLDALAPESAVVWWDVLIVTAAGPNGLGDVFMFVEDDHEVMLRELAREPLRQADLDAFETLLAASDWDDASPLAASLSQRVEGFMAARREAAAKRDSPPPKSRHPDASEGSASIRVEAARLDNMVDLVGELVIIQSRLSQTAGNGDDPQLRAIAEEVQRLSGQLRDEVLGLRMVPIGGIFGTFRRLVRDLGDTLGKQAVFIGEGGETEMDKNVIDRLKDPLVHILRNCIDHGIESAKDREAAGKPAQGTICLRADHVGSEVRIVINDDGGGVNLERVREKAVAQGLLGPGEEADERRLLEFLFHPGFSTAQKLSSVSGRGVGMDVVKRNIEEMGGAVLLESRAGQGTTLTVRLPLTLAIIDGLQVRVGREDYTIPLAAARACLERFVTGEPSVIGTITWQEQMTPCLSLRRLLGVDGPQPDYERVIMVVAGELEVGLAVDAVIGQRQAVIKRLSDVYRKVDFVSGTTVNGDGSISLILDVARLVRFAASTQH
jgi:two-component system, chemotaxis family, sensor kinase CheA